MIGLAELLLAAAAAVDAQPSDPLTRVAGQGVPVTTSWRVAGDRSVRPERIRDDGLRIYLEWGQEQSLPAVFAIGPTGEEQVVDGYMRGSVFVVDRLHATLVFRIDKDRATATRRRAGK